MPTIAGVAWAHGSAVKQEHAVRNQTTIASPAQAIVGFERFHPEATVQRNLIGARDLRAAYLRDLLLAWIKPRPKVGLGVRSGLIARST
jgi:hypothetical protein